MATIKAPDPYYYGTVGVGAKQVTFNAGVAETDDPEAIAFCRAAGYDITEGVAAPEAGSADARPAARPSKP